MGFKVGSKEFYTDDGIPYVWGSGDKLETLTTYDTKIWPTYDGLIPSSGDYFGYSVAVGSGRIVVGAYEDNGPNNDQTDQGSAYIFDLDGTQIAKITANDGTSYDRFGHRVAVGCGRIVVGAYLDDHGTSSTVDSGSAYIFDLDGTQQAKITASDAFTSDHFGSSVAVGCGRIVVGATGDDVQYSNQGAVYIYDLDGNNEIKITPDDARQSDYFGRSVAIGCGRIVVGAHGDNVGSNDDQGSAYIFDLDGNQLAKITADDGDDNDQFGISVAVGSGRIVVGAFQNDDGGTDSGSAYIFDLDGNQLKKINAFETDGISIANDNFGVSVAVGSGRIVVGADEYSDTYTNQGAAYVFDLDGNQLEKITVSDGANYDNFGISVAAGLGKIVVGAWSHGTGTGTDSGTAYIYDTPQIYTIYDAIEHQKGNL